MMHIHISDAVISGILLLAYVAVVAYAIIRWLRSRRKDLHKWPDDL